MTILCGIFIISTKVRHIRSIWPLNMLEYIFGNIIPEIDLDHKESETEDTLLSVSLSLTRVAYTIVCQYKKKKYSNIGGIHKPCGRNFGHF